MRNIIGVLLIICGILLGVYVGLWVMFVGGVLGLVEVVNGLIAGTGLDGMLIVWSVLKIMFASFVGYVSAVVLIVPGRLLLNNFGEGRE